MCFCFDTFQYTSWIMLNGGISEYVWVCIYICIFELHLRCYLKYVCMCTCEHSNFYVYMYVYNTERHIPISPMKCSHIVEYIFCQLVASINRNILSAFSPSFPLSIYTYVKIQIFDNVYLLCDRLTVFIGGYFDHHAYFEPLELFWGIFSALKIYSISLLVASRFMAAIIEKEWL